MKHYKKYTKYTNELIYDNSITEEYKTVSIPNYGDITINNLGTKLLSKTGKQPPIYEDDSGYLGCYVGLNKPGGHHFLRFHRMVALAFLDNPNNLPEVNHKDLNKKNNSVTNLEWINGIDNIRHAIQHGKTTSRKGEVNGRAKLNTEQIKEIRNQYNKNPIKGKIAQLAKEYNVSWTMIKNIVTNKNWKDI